MARPLKDGVDYWNKDCDFYSDGKIRLIRSEFSGNGMYMLDYILCEIYKNGYYIKFDKDWCSMVSDGAVCGGSPNFVEELVKGCVRRSVFDKGVFDAFGILTSKGIQKRYIRMVCGRDHIRLIKEYCLLDLDDPFEVPEKIRAKIVLKSISNTKNSVFDTRNSVNHTNKTQSKVKESKVKRKERESGCAAFSTPTIDEVALYIQSKNYKTFTAERFCRYYDSIGWRRNGEIITEWKALADSWEANQYGTSEIKTKRKSSFDIEELEELSAFND